MVNLDIKFKGRKIKVQADKTSFFEMIRGLMFRSRNTKNLLFDFKKRGWHPIHSYFVFFPFLAIWTDNKNKVVDVKIVKSFLPYVLPKKQFNKLVEVPINEKNRKIIAFFVGK